MSYPESGASHHYTPKWLDENKKKEGAGERHHMPHERPAHLLNERADGGAVSTKYPNKIPGLTDEQIDANEARRPKNEMPGMNEMQNQQATSSSQSDGMSNMAKQNEPYNK